MASTSLGQWQAIRLHPDGYFDSAVYGISQGHQAGYFRQASFADQPVVWAGTASSAVALAPPSQSEASEIYAVSGSAFVGARTTAASLNPSASLWPGISGTRIDLNPAGARSSTAVGCSGNEQVGHAYINNNDHAGVWHGSAASWIDLQPSGMLRSDADATDGIHQVGEVVFPGGSSIHAAMWSGSAASFADMNPTGARGSGIAGIGGNQQAGSVFWPGIANGHAALWFGTPDSVIDLHPAQSGPGYSGLTATDGIFQVGVASIGTFGHAGIWQGTAASFVDLHALLPPGYVSSAATCVEEYHGQTWVGGYATNSLGNKEAFLWVSVPAPASCVVLIAGTLLAGPRRSR